MKIIVAGTRSIVDEDIIFKIIDKSDFDITEVVSGGARGVDIVAEKWAKSRKIPIKQFLPHYNVENPKYAPLLRNTDMAAYADGLIAIWDGKSKGTKHMIDSMKRLNKPVEIKEII